MKKGSGKMMGSNKMMGAKKMGMGGKVYKTAPITAAGGTNLNGKKMSNKMS